MWLDDSGTSEPSLLRLVTFPRTYGPRLTSRSFKSEYGAIIASIHTQIAGWFGGENKYR